MDPSGCFVFPLFERSTFSAIFQQTIDKQALEFTLKPTRPKTNIKMAYDWTKPEESLNSIKTNILDAMKIEETWYVKHRAIHSFFSRTIRVCAVLLFAFGILWPVLSADKINQIAPTFNYGYLSLAVGGLLLLLDKYLGISSGYVRFYIAELDIKKNTLEFIENWDIETAKASRPMTIENILALLTIVKQFRQAVFTTIQVETGAWGAEFQTQTGELYELFKQKQSEMARPANISVSVENYTNYNNIEIGLDDAPLIKLGATTSIIFRNVSVQPHLIRIKAAKSDNSLVAFSKNAEAYPDKTTDVAMILP